MVDESNDEPPGDEKADSTEYEKECRNRPSNYVLAQGRTADRLREQKGAKYHWHQTGHNADESPGQK